MSEYDTFCYSLTTFVNRNCKSYYRHVKLTIIHTYLVSAKSFRQLCLQLKKVFRLSLCSTTFEISLEHCFVYLVYFNNFHTYLGVENSFLMNYFSKKKSTKTDTSVVQTDTISLKISGVLQNHNSSLSWLLSAGLS